MPLGSQDIRLREFKAGTLAGVFVCLIACAGPQSTTPIHVSDAETLTLEGVAACTSDQPDRLRLDPNEPLVVLVHGCYSSGSRFKELAEVFEFHGQQVLCYNYNDRDSLRAVAFHLQDTLAVLQKQLPGQQITIIGHSQGGLISRIAMSDWTAPPVGSDYRLVTVSTPLSGIEAAEHCGWTGLHILSLGITVGLCQAIVGSNWTEIPPNSRIWTQPLPLHPAVSSHLNLVTDEEGTCRARDADGECDEDDYVFSTAEQLNAKIESDPRVTSVVAKAGHAQIVGETGAKPETLIRLLQNHNVLRATPPARRAALARLISNRFRGTRF